MYKCTAVILSGLLLIFLGACTAVPTPASPTPDQEFVFGMVLVGAQDDMGWSEAHYKGGRYIEANLPHTHMLVLDKLNASDHPEMTLEDAVDSMVTQGAQLIFLTSDEFAADTNLVAQQHPQTVFIQVTGDHVLRGDALPNVGNYMARMVYGKAIAGCAAALQTKTGQIGYLGPLVNDETRRLVNAAYLGARYCYAKYRGLPAADLRFRVEWVGFWFHIPNITADPIQLTNALFDWGADVVLSGLDTTEATAVTRERAAAGAVVRVIPYDYDGACAEAPDLCLGVPYFNWGPGYLKIARQVLAGTWTSGWEWDEPNWQHLQDTSPIGFLKGTALTENQSAELDEFIAGLAQGSIAIFQGPLTFQDGSSYLGAGEVARDEQVWYMPQLLAGMEGSSE